MARLMFALFAERVSADQFSNTLDIHGLVEQVQTFEPPKEVFAKARKDKKPLGVRAQLMLLAHWRRSDLSKAEIGLRQRTQLFGPKGKLLDTAEQEFNLRQGQYTRNILKYDVLPLAGEGTYTSRISLKTGKRWREVGRASFELAYIRPIPVDAKVRLQ